ncbi:lysophospholipid acyltransferase family protein [Raineyella fluvialis]|uniref:1-acyl-sn-glycerol-3-phosphate acyltransferase n=1 Tax=Raineyella fluvialis TaxID=2662261 RepID=A0A5Q2FHE8_9ACTN|nr:lysophospholipid acyltransferase family protein [Raineyella fluvialis]QGF25207.1 1-acyl-sn-glycerol-3-phosphate acyltransferase [Raineyella fluvialis]
MAYSLFKRLLFRPAIVGLWRPWVEGGENVPESGPALMASNHISAGDTLMLPAMIRRRMVFPAKAEAFHGKDPKSRVVAWFLKAVGMHPMDRSGGRASAESLVEVSDVLGHGDLLGIYPEGTRSPDGRLYKGKTGVARLALHSGAPVIPVAMINSQLVKGPLGIPLMRKPGIRIGRPLDFSEYRGRDNERDVLRWITDRIMAAIAELSGQEYVDVYGTSVKAGNFTPEQLATKVLARPGLNTPKPPAAVSPAPNED